MKAVTPPTLDEYYMGIAIAVRKKANCHGFRVGAAMVKNNRIVSTGYNGTPEGMTNCLDGGCHRCANRDQYPSGVGYDLCICVHAEQNALLAAARFGISLEGAVVYTTLQPCFGCMKEMLQAKIAQVFFLHPWQQQSAERLTEYERLANRFSDGMKAVSFPDDEEVWALSTHRDIGPPTDEHGHQA